MIPAIMADATQEQEKNAADSNSANEEISPSIKEVQETVENEKKSENESEVKGEAKTEPGPGPKSEPEPEPQPQLQPQMKTEIDEVLNKETDGETNKGDDEEVNKKGDGQANKADDCGANKGDGEEVNKKDEKKTSKGEDEEVNKGADEEVNKGADEEVNKIDDGEANKGDGKEVNKRDDNKASKGEDEVNKGADQEVNKGDDGDFHKKNVGEVNGEDGGGKNEGDDGDETEEDDGGESEVKIENDLGGERHTPGVIEGNYEVDNEDDEGENEETYDGENEGDDEEDEDLVDEDGENEEIDDERLPEGKVEKPLDHDQDRRNPQYIPKGGTFYEHDNRTSLEDVENKDPQEVEKKKKVWKESKESERWLHDWYKESEQTPKTKAEIIQIYGYDIRKEEAPPRARRRRKYGRGPDKYERNWKDEQAYTIKQNGPGRRGRKKNFGKDEFPPLPNQRRNDSSVEKAPPKNLTWKKPEEEPPKNKSPKVNSQDRQPPGNQFSRNEQTSQRNSNLGPYSNKKTPAQSNRKINEEEIKPFRNDKNKWKSNNFRRGKQDEVPQKLNKTKPLRQGEAQTPRNVDSNKNSSGDPEMAHLTESFCQMTFHSKHSNMRDRQNSNEIAEQELDSPANRLNPKRYSKNRKSFTGFFPPEDIVEIDPAEMKQLQQEQQQKTHVNLPQQPLNIQSVIRRYPGTYNGNPGYMPTRPIITGIPNQGVSPQGLQQALSPQGIPQQALSPQVPGLQTIELQQGPLPPQANFVPPMYIDMDPHYGPSEMMGAYTGYAPYSASQPSEMYQPSGGITYYNTECQTSNQIRPPPARRQKAIPIVPPPE